MSVSLPSQNFLSLPDDALVLIPVIQVYLGGVSRATVWRRLNDGSLPKVMAGPGLAGTRMGDLRAYVKDGYVKPTQDAAPPPTRPTKKTGKRKSRG